MGKLWDRLTAAFLDWDTGEVAGRAVEVRTAALGVVRNRRKIEAILARADDLARNLGWDVLARTGAVPRPAGFIETTPERLCTSIAAPTCERIRTMDLMLWNWGNQVGDVAMREFAFLVRFT